MEVRIFVTNLFFLVLMFFPGSTVASEYFVDSVLGRDFNSGVSEASPWRTLSKINIQKFKPGDVVRLKCGSVWNEELVVPSSGQTGKPLLFTTYGKGNKPIIKATNDFNDWELVLNQGGAKVWKGKIPEISNFFGAVVNGSRLPHYHKYHKNIKYPSTYEDISEGYFYAPLNKGIFYYRHDSGYPGTVEVGTRPRAVTIKGKRNIVIEGIDVTGPGGSMHYGSHTETSLVVIDSSDNVVIKNCSISNGSISGASIENGSTNCRFESVVSFGHGSTGLYFSNAGSGNIAINCKVYNCGNLFTDKGDMGLIGVWKTPGVTIKGCELYNNGFQGAKKIDAAISFVRSPSGKVVRCLLKNIGGTGIQFAENSNDCIAIFNVIHAWGGIQKVDEAYGIRVGGGYAASTAKNIRIFNNLLTNPKGLRRKEDAAIRVEPFYSNGLEVVNNIFYLNNNGYDIIAEPKRIPFKWSFSHNLYYRKYGNAIKWLGKIYDYKHILGSSRGFYSFDTRDESDSIFADPKLNYQNKSLMNDSPCIDTGLPLGGIGLLGINKSLLSTDKANIGPF